MPGFLGGVTTAGDTKSLGIPSSTSSGSTSPSTASSDLQAASGLTDPSSAPTGATGASQGGLDSLVNMSLPQPVNGAPSVHDLASYLPTASSGGDGGSAITPASSAILPAGNQHAIVDAAKTWLGTPYVYGGTGRGGVDCSGFTQAVYNQLGVNIGRDTSAQFKSGQAVGVDGNFQQTLNQLQPGDLLFYGKPGATGPNAHVAMYIGNGQVIQAPHTAVSVTPIFSAADASEPFLGARRYVAAANNAAPASINTPQQFATYLLQGLGITPNAGNVQGLVDWENAEGGNWHNPDTFNPLNTTQPYGTSHATNGAGVRAYQSWADGLAATLQTLNNGRYAGILQALRGNSPQAIEQAVAASPWGTGAYNAS